MTTFKAPESDEARNHHRGWLLMLKEKIQMLVVFECTWHSWWDFFEVGRDFCG